MKVCNAAREAAIDFFGKWIRLIVRSQARLDVTNRNLPVECSEAADEGRRGISLHENHIGLRLEKDAVEGRESVLGKFCERLPRLHNVEVVIRLYAEDFQHLVQHLPVLRSCNRDGPEMAMPSELEDDGGELDRIRSCSENHRYFFATWNHRQPNRFI